MVAGMDRVVSSVAPPSSPALIPSSFCCIVPAFEHAITTSPSFSFLGRGWALVHDSVLTSPSGSVDPAHFVDLLEEER